jgi:hypothetical protein
MPTTNSGLVIDRRAYMALNGFPSEDQSRIRSSLGHLLGPAAIEELGGRVHRLPGDEPLYSIRVPPDIRVIFTRLDNTIVVVDVLRRGTLETFASGSATVIPAVDPGPEQTERPLKQADRVLAKHRAKSHRGTHGGSR